MQGSLYLQDRPGDEDIRNGVVPRVRKVAREVLKGSGSGPDCGLDSKTQECNNSQPSCEENRLVRHTIAANTYCFPRDTQ
jgi:hypothetical protein